MKQDIREIFKNDELPKKKLPNFHEDEFLEKLEKFNKKKTKKTFFKTWKIAASIVLIFSVGYYFLSTNTEKTPTLFVQVKKIEKEYLQNIDTEWNTFIKLTDDKNLIERYEQKLKEYATDYKKITKQLKEFPNSINILESLIENLQRRLQIIKDIQEHIKELNQKNISNETIYL